MTEMHLRQSRFTYSARGSFTKTTEKFKILKKKQIQDIFIETNTTKCASSIIWLKDLSRRTSSVPEE